MKKDTVTILIVTLILMDTLTFFADLSPYVYANSTSFPTVGPSVFVDPSNITKFFGETFTVAVKVFNLTGVSISQPGLPEFKIPLGNLYGLSIQLFWEPTIIEYVSHTVTIPVETYPEGILHDPVMEVINEVNPSAGTYRIDCASVAPDASPFNNPGANSTVFTMTFRVIGKGATLLRLPIEEIELVDNTGKHLGWDSTGSPRYLYSFDGYVSVVGAPNADFTYWPSDAAVVNKQVTFNASASYDTAPGGAITLYMWDFGDGTKQNTTDPIITHSFTQTGEYYVKLRVLDNEVPPSISAPKTKVVYVVNRRDIAITSIAVTPPQILQNSNVTIDVSVRNEGDVKENSTLSAYYNKTAVDTTTEWVEFGRRSVVNLQSGAITSLTLKWNTTGVTPETYYFIKVNASRVPQEEDVDDNNRVSTQSVFVTLVETHDIAVVAMDIVASEGEEEFPAPFILGETAYIAFDVKANGTVDETFNATLSVLAPNGTLLFTKDWTSQSLEVGKTSPLNHTFSTSGYVSGNYEFSVNATIIKKDDRLGNNYVEKTFMIIRPPVIEITPLPSPIHAGETIAFDARASSHADGQITKYEWTFSEAGTVRFTKSGSLVDATFDTAGDWEFTLKITDNYGITFSELRVRTSAYRRKERIVVEAGASEFPLWAVYGAMAIIAVAIIALLLFLRLKRSKPK